MQWTWDEPLEYKPKGTLYTTALEKRQIKHEIQPSLYRFFVRINKYVILFLFVRIISSFSSLSWSLILFFNSVSYSKYEGNTFEMNLTIFILFLFSSENKQNNSICMKHKRNDRKIHKFLLKNVTPVFLLWFVGKRWTGQAI